MEKYQSVCDKDLKCPGREEGMRQIEVAQQFYAKNAGGAEYTGPEFKFCPWCGKEIVGRQKGRQA